MPQYPKKVIPAGFALREFPDGHWQGYRINAPDDQSHVYTRRNAAVAWCYVRLGEIAAKVQAMMPKDA